MHLLHGLVCVRARNGSRHVQLPSRNLMDMAVGHGWQTPSASVFNLRSRRQSLEASKDFSSALCKKLSLPRELGWYCGGPITTSINVDGESVVVHRRRLYKIPKFLLRCGIDSWNITKEVATFVIDTDPRWKLS